MENENPMLRLIVYGKLKQMMMSYAGSKLRNIDKNLIRGIYLRRIKDFKEDLNERREEKKTLLSRLKTQLMKMKSIKKSSDLDETSSIDKVNRKTKKQKSRIKVLESSISLSDSMRSLKQSIHEEDLEG